MVVARAWAYTSADSPNSTGEPDANEEMVAGADLAPDGLLAAMEVL